MKTLQYRVLSLALLALLVWVLAGTSASFAMGVPQIQYLSHEEFLQQAFPAGEPHWKMLMLKPPVRKEVEAILGHPYPGSRLRYWQAGQRTAWILDEVGKDLPITLGVVIDQDQIVQVNVLVYREERGGEIHEDFFTRQFHQVTLGAAGELSKPIDGITGATLSVNAVTRVARLVLALHQRVVASSAH